MRWLAELAPAGEVAFIGGDGVGGCVSTDHHQLHGAGRGSIGGDSGYRLAGAGRGYAGGAGKSGAAPTGARSGGAGGSGIVIIRHATADATPAVSGGDVVATCGSDTIRVFTGSGTFTA